ncbi:diguanylate cyclase [Nitrosomonas sp.]|uniref:GGDEF domain-containing protein n=1 Tax=Nitrosomonas sp. TaxID=42353 RepID=UPI0026014995|nr:diguanylate cyclase [Nitrosomonas sp.]MBY0483329.1 diguanylate cyclase [Nitrosomonas sp.]
MTEHINQLEVFPWNKNFETGIEIIDVQHQKLISLLNELAGALVRGNHLEINYFFDALAKYAEFHFETEEAIWIEYFGDDSWLSSHQLTHSSFLPKVVEIKEQETNKPQNEIIESIILFLIRWLAFHILDNDKRMAFVVQNVNKGLSLEEAKIVSDKKMNGSIRVLIETVMIMYDSLSSRTLVLMRENYERQKIEAELHKANKQLRKVNLKLEALAMTDQLTGLFNRRHFRNVFAREIKRAHRHNIYLALIILDIDFFKRINDNYGHSKGDQVLIQISRKLKKLCQRPDDYAFRLGGEEFGVIAANLDHQGTVEFAEIIRKGIEELKILNGYSDGAKHLTVSIGTVTKTPDEMDTIDSYMAIADARLYKAKELGRNQAVTGE